MICSSCHFVTVTVQWNFFQWELKKNTVFKRNIQPHTHPYVRRHICTILTWKTINDAHFWPIWLKRKQKWNMQCNIASKHTIALNVNSTLKWNVKARYEAFNISFFPGYSQTKRKQQHQQSVANVFDWSCAIFWYIFFLDGESFRKISLEIFKYIVHNG